MTSDCPIASRIKTKENHAMSTKELMIYLTTENPDPELCKKFDQFLLKIIDSREKKSSFLYGEKGIGKGLKGQNIFLN